MHKIDYSRYIIHEDGTVFDRKINRILKFHKCRLGYLKVHLSGKRYGAHFIVAKKFIPNPENKPEVNHKDCNKANNHYSNLEWVTHRENIIHAYKMGRCLPNNVRAILDKVDIIRDEYGTGKFSIQSIADKYHVSYTTIYNMIKRKSIIYQ